MQPTMWPWFFCLLFLLHFGPCMSGGITGELDAPSLDTSAPRLHVGVTHSFTCIPPPSPVSPDSFEFFLDGAPVYNGSDNSYSLAVDNTVVGTSLTCQYTVSSISSQSSLSGPYVIAVEPLPAAVYSVVNPSQPVRDSQPYDLMCSPPNYVVAFIDSYRFKETLVARQTTLNSFGSTGAKTVTPSQFELKNFACDYQIGSSRSSTSNIISLLATIILEVLTVPSSFQAFSGQSVNFSCNVTTDPLNMAPVGGNIFTYKWFDGMGNLEPMSNVSDITRMVTSNLTYRCEAAANNELFVTSVAQTVSLVAIPVVTITPPSTLLFFVGTSYTFECTSSAQSVVSYTWIVDMVPVLTSSANQYNVTMPAAPYSGVLQCTIDLGDSITAAGVPFPITSTEIPKPTIPQPSSVYFSGNTYVFQCQSSPIANVNYTAFSWQLNGSLIQTQQSNQLTLDIPQPPYAVSMTCMSIINSSASEESDPIGVTASVIPQPSIVVSPDHGIFINGISYNFNCTSAFSSFITEYRFNFANNSLNRAQADSNITIVADVSQAMDFVCVVSNYNSSSAPSESISLVGIVLSPPTIQVLNMPPHFVVDTQQAFECLSDLEDVVTMYCLKNFSTDVRCQNSKTFTFTPEENEQILSCNIFIDEVFTDYSDGVSVIGSGIVSMRANASNHMPYPGTNVTLTCSANVIDSYDESNVTFTLRDSVAPRAQTKVTSVYITNNMVESFHCQGTTGRVNVSSDVLNITARDLPTPSIEVLNQPADNFEPGYYYRLVCNSELENLLTSYNWYKDDQMVADVHTKQYLVQAMSFTHLYTCTFVVVTEESPASPNLTIATKSILSVHVESSGLRDTTLTPLFNSVLILSCEATLKSTATESPLYSWLQSGFDVGSERELTIHAYAGYDHQIVCEVTVGDDFMTSNQTTVTATENLSPPEMSLSTHQVSQILPRASYTLHCISTSLSLNSTVTWYKDLSELSCLRDLTLDITRYEPSIHDGQYTCEIAVFGMAATSGPTVLLGIVPGKQCQGSQQCTNLGDGYTGECENNRCVCSNGYMTRLESCVLA